MKKILIRKHEDFEIKIDSSFNIIFTDKFSGKVERFPILLGEDTTLDIPDMYFDIIDFMNKRKPYIVGENVEIFLKLVNLEITPFIWLLMKNLKIDVFFNKGYLYIVDFDSEKYIVLNNKNMSIGIFNKLYGNQVKSNNAYYVECKEELYTFIRNRIQNSIGHNEIINCQMKDFKNTQSKMEKEFLKSTDFDIKKALFLYENLIRIKEEYLNETHYLLSEETIGEIAYAVEQIRMLAKNPPNYTSKPI